MSFFTELIGQMKVPPTLIKEMIERMMTALMESISTNLYTVCYLSVITLLLVCGVIVVCAFSTNLYTYALILCLNRMGGALKKAPFLIDFQLLESMRLCMTTLHMKTLLMSLIPVIRHLFSRNHSMSSVKMTS